MNKAEATIEAIRKQEQERPENLDFLCAMYIAGDRNKELRREMMHILTGESLPLSKCGMYAVSNQLKVHFAQLQLF